jgi:hypothetical protein
MRGAVDGRGNCRALTKRSVTFKEAPGLKKYRAYFSSGRFHLNACENQGFLNSFYSRVYAPRPPRRLPL